MSGLSEDVQAAFTFASREHENQFRKDDTTPYIIHPIRVCYRLYRAGIRDDDILCAALLHDCIEDTDRDPGAVGDEIHARFGNKVSCFVDEMTHFKTKQFGDTRKEYVQGFMKKSPETCLIKLADRLDNLRDWTGLDPKYKPVYALEAMQLLHNTTRRYSNLKITMSRDFKVAFRMISKELNGEIGMILFSAGQRDHNWFR